MKTETPAELGRRIKHWQKEVADAPDDGNAYADGGRCDEAIAAYLKAVSLQEDNPFFYFNLGVAYKQENMYDAAVEVFRELMAAQQR